MSLIKLLIVALHNVTGITLNDLEEKKVLKYILEHVDIEYKFKGNQILLKFKKKF